MTIDEELREKAKELRVELIGFSPAEKTTYADIIRMRISRGLIPPEMVARTECFRIPEVYSDPSKSLEGAKSIVCLGQPYFENGSIPSDLSKRAYVARHYWRDSYTDLLARRDRLIDFIRSKGYKAEKAKMHPREAARMAGHGYIGKNNFVINRTYGTWCLYFALVTDAVLEPTPRIEKHCPENCRKCIDACPSKALVEPYTLEVGKCLNFLMTDNAAIPEYARPLIRNNINGCDVCQEACPMNKKAKTAPEPMPARKSNPDMVPFPTLERCLRISDQEMKDHYAYMDWYEPETRYMYRNALIALGNSGQRELANLAKPFETSDDPVLREHARWATSRLG